MNTTALADDPTVATDALPRWREPIASRLGHETAAVEDPTPAEDGVEGANVTDYESVERGGPSESDSTAPARWWVLVAPLAGSVVLSAASWAFAPLRTGTSPSGLVAFAVLIPYFLLCTAGTLALFRDATRLRAAGVEWSPNPWHYAVPSAVALAAVRAVPEGRSVGGTAELVGVLVGSLVVALVASSILAGPVYLLQRRRRVGGGRSGPD